MGAKSSQNGKRGEKIAEEFFRSHGYWVHLTGRSDSGSQPVDIIAVRQQEAWLLDAKFVAKERPSFSFDDVQPNQVASMRYARDYAKIANLGFFIVFERDLDHPKFLSFETYEKMAEEGKKSINMERLANFSEIMTYLECIR